MDEQTRKLLEECCSGCRMAIESFRQVQEYVKDTGLKQLISTYTEKHCQLEEEAASLLKESGNPEKSPGIMASGCAMGIKTLGEKSHQYSQADKKAVSLTDRIIRTEEDLMKKLKDFL